MDTPSFREFKRMLINFASRSLCRALNSLCYLLALVYNKPKRSTIPPITEKELVTSAVKLSQQIKQGTVTSEQVVSAYVNRIKLVNPLINAVVDHRFDKALERARELDRRLAAARQGVELEAKYLKMPLVGIPVSIKETIALEGHSYTGGLLARKLTKATKNADAVERLYHNGLIPIVLTNVPELAMWWDSCNPVYGKTNNPYDLSRIPGGSSGGEAALISSAGSIVGIGSDIAGSIRMPAHFCGIYGHKPTPKVVPTEGMFPFCHGEREMLLGLGPLSRYACDLAPMLKVLAGPAGRKLNLDQQVEMRKLKIFYMENLNDPLASECDPEIVKGMHKAIAYLVEKFKVPAEKVYLDELKYGLLLWSAEADKEPNIPSLAKQLKEGSSGELNPCFELGKKLLRMSDHNFTSIVSVALEKCSPRYGTQAQKLLSQKAHELRRKFNSMLGDHGILLIPTHPETAPLHETTAAKVFNVSYTSATAVLHAPITQVPLGLSSDGLPYGVQVFAKPLNDRLTLAVAEELERHTGGWSAPCRINL